MDNQKIYKTLEIIVKAVLAIAALWLCISCTMSMSISKNNMNSSQSTEQSQATSVDSTKIHCRKSYGSDTSNEDGSQN